MVCVAIALTLGLLWSVSISITKVKFTSTKLHCWRSSYIPYNARRYENYIIPSAIPHMLSTVEFVYDKTLSQDLSLGEALNFNPILLCRCFVGLVEFLVTMYIHVYGLTCS